jgi:ABC-type uncharacterized transport system fused permease/ATPase subunit
MMDSNGVKLSVSFLGLDVEMLYTFVMAILLILSFNSWFIVVYGTFLSKIS